MLVSFGSNIDSDLSEDISATNKVRVAIDCLSHYLSGVTVIRSHFLDSTPAHSKAGTFPPLPAYANAMSLYQIPAVYSGQWLNDFVKEVEILLGRKRPAPRVEIDIDIVATAGNVFRAHELSRNYCRIPIFVFLLEELFAEDKSLIPIFLSAILS